MGHGHHEPFKVPHYSAYNHWRSIPHLTEYSDRLARIGLKDPWVRNYVYKLDPNSGNIKSSTRHIIDLLRPGILPGLVVAGTIIALEEGYSFFKHRHTSWSGGHH